MAIVVQASQSHVSKTNDFVKKVETLIMDRISNINK